MGKLRRSRFQRTPTGKRLTLSARDLRLFRILASYRYLPATYLFPLAGGRSETRFKERLGDLFHEGFLDRPTQQWLYAESNWWPVVYELDRGARNALTDSGALCAPTTFLGNRAHRQFAHALMICECLASIELSTYAHRDVRFIPWTE
jgi:hypothetical protein